MFENLFITSFACYKPPVDSPKDSPKLDYVDPLFKRRLSQLSRMTIEVVKQVKDNAPEAKIFFTSYRGEIGRQLKINRGLVDDYDILPAQFSLSVFNTPPAVATIALGMKNGYSAVYPSQGRLYDAFVAGVSPLLAGLEKKVIFVYGDELIPQESQPIENQKEKEFFPFAFAMVISTEKEGGWLALPEEMEKMTAEDFYEYLAKGDKSNG